MNVLLLSMPDSFEHMPPIAIRMPNGALASLAGNVDAHQVERNTRSILELAGGTDVEVALGRDRPLVKAIETISGTIKRIDDISSTIAASVEEQGAATGEIAQNVQQAAQGTQEVSSNISGVRNAANETGRVSGEIVHAATDLDVQANSLRTQVDNFIARVRAA